MVCSHCHQSGHTYRTCGTMTDEEKKEKKDKIAAEKERLRLQRHRNQVNRDRILQYNTKTDYEVANMTDYEMVLYWVTNTGNMLSKFSYVGQHSTTKINCVKCNHRIVAIPFLEVCTNSPNAIKTIPIPGSGEIPYVTVFDVKMKDFDGLNIIIDSDYKPKKTELDQWKECALKSRYLLDQLIKLGGLKHDNLAPILDMVQDISIPNTCNEMDKELAGVPSVLTNIT